MVDHIARPNVFGSGTTIERRAQHAAWARGLRELAEREHVACKLSNPLTEGGPHAWHQLGVEALYPYLDVVLEAFGMQRCMIGVDWPVCTLAASYEEAIDMVRTYVGHLSEAEQRAVLRENALHWYRIAGATVGGSE